MNVLAAEEAPPLEDDLALMAFGEGDPTHAGG